MKAGVMGEAGQTWESCSSGSSVARALQKDVVDRERVITGQTKGWRFALITVLFWHQARQPPE